MQTDPIGYEDGMNWYAYVGNDPVNGKDPTGLCKFKKERCDGGQGNKSKVASTNDSSFEDFFTDFVSDASSSLDSFLEENIDFNPVKLGVGVANGANSVRLGMKSKVLAYASAFTFGIGQPEFGLPLAALSVTAANSAGKAAIRSGTQLGEAFAESYSDASRVNLKGLLPNGQHFDDINEPTAVEFYKQNFNGMKVWDVIGEVGTMF